jgi:hypothetical protein
MATTATPDGVLLEVPARGGDSPSQERLSRIAAMLRDADMAAHPSVRRRGGSRQVSVRRR